MNFNPLLFFLVLLAGGLSSHVTAETDSLDPYQKLLAQYVVKGKKNNIPANLINYDLWAKNPLHKKAMNKILKADTARLKGRQKMAFWINAYNLLTIDLIIKKAERETIKNLGSWWRSPWVIHRWNINGQSITLDHIEHKILRPMGDPRIHMAIVCASLSCPDLRREPYNAKKLNQQLDDQTRAFLNNKRKGVNASPDGINLSQIFKWFAQDFGTQKDIIRFVQKYKPDLPKQTSINSHLDYDWSLNNYSP